MLADSTARSQSFGSLAPGVIPPGALLGRIVDFIAEHLPGWRDFPERRKVEGEPQLTAQLRSYLNTMARKSIDFDRIQFSTEEPDSAHPSRRLDLAVQPCDDIIIVEGRRFTMFDVLLPMECKRLPIPKGHGRDEREYVTTTDAAGGIERFKLGLHGSSHSLGVMIGYIQEDEPAQWMVIINQWLRELGEADAFWHGEQLAAEPAAGAVLRLRSAHLRRAPAARIELMHLWVALGPR